MLSVSDVISALPFPPAPHPMARPLAALLALAAERGRRTVDRLTCGDVARALGMSIDDLEAALLSLSREGLVAADPEGRLILASPAALNRFAAEPPAAAVLAA